MASMTRQTAMPRASNIGVNISSQIVQIRHGRHLQLSFTNHLFLILYAHFFGNSNIVNLRMNNMFASMSHSGRNRMNTRVKIVFPQNEKGS